MSVAGLLFAVFAVVLGCVLTYIFSLRAFRRRVSEMQDTTQRQLNTLTSIVKDLEAHLAEASRAERSVPSAGALPESEAAPQPQTEATAQEEEITVGVAGCVCGSNYSVSG